MRGFLIARAALFFPRASAPPLNVLYAVLLGIAFTIIELLIGGTRLLFSLPAYGVLALIALLSLIDLRRPKLPPDGLVPGRVGGVLRLRAGAGVPLAGGLHRVGR